MLHKQTKTYLLLGSNMGDSSKMIEIAKKNISLKIGEIVRSSSLYKTAAWGKKGQPDFLNQVIVVVTNQSPEKLMKTILEIESKMGRVRKEKNEARKIDIDILFYDKAIINSPKLIVPHPLLHKRKFVLKPLNELSPQFKHPTLAKTVHTLLHLCKDSLTVEKKQTN
ncbi:MAG: 2-amino-4-hydroxy-6-hydroxymethyldihydropteridine diphosphokinase [Ferruginibacter sp.]|nr:2-amino-4-hydroxy-6-hydroxymethyldihydropteridine diphosphokinase [Ferruginibacter sp.]